MKNWTTATTDDARGYMFPSCAEWIGEASPHRLASLLSSHDKSTPLLTNDGHARVRALLIAALGLDTRPHKPRDPYGAISAFGTQQSAVPEDWRGASTDVLEVLGRRAAHPVVRARLLDLAWHIDRRRRDAATEAAEAYAAVASGLYTGKLADATAKDLPVLKSDALARALQRGLQICHLINGATPAAALLTDLAEHCTATFTEANDTDGRRRMLGLAVEFGLGDAAVRAERLEALATTVGESDPHARADDFTNASIAFGAIGDHAGRDRCRLAASRILAAHARSIPHALMTAHFLQQAIDVLRGLSSNDVKAAKRALRRELMHVRETIGDELVGSVTTTDVTDLVKAQVDAFGKLSLFDSLFALADVWQPRSPDELVGEAIDSVSRFPFTSMFGTEHTDAKGHVRHRTEGGEFGTPSPAAIGDKLARDEALSRQFIVRTCIDPATHHLSAHFSVGQNDLVFLLRHSWRVPSSLLNTYARGFTALIHGDMTPAIAILIPLMEATFIHALKLHGVEVITHREEKGTQEEMSLTRVFEKHRKAIDTLFGAAMAADVERVYISRSGPGLRHMIAHGTLHDGTGHSPDARYACWLLYRLCLQPLFAHMDALRKKAPRHLHLGLGG